MREECHFLRGDGSCAVLRVDFCCDSKHCSFYKTSAQFEADRDKAILLCRKKGLCRKCIYTDGQPCKLRREKFRYYNGFLGVK